MIKEALQTEIQKICTKRGIMRQVFLEHPQELSHGDFATSIALSAAKDLKQNPKELAENLAQKIRDTNDTRIASVTTAGPGFINLTLTQEALSTLLTDILEKEETYGKNNFHAGKKILVEHSSPNLFKPFHIGHLMNNTIGEAVTRIIKNTGAAVYTMSFPSDVSLGIAKAIFILTTKIDQWQSIFNKNNIYDSIKFLGDCYVQGFKYFEDHPEEIEKAKVINRAMNYVNTPITFNSELISLIDLHNQVRSVSELYFRNIINLKLDSKIDEFVFESVAADVWKYIYDDNKDIFKQGEEGAIIYIPHEDRKDINTSVFVNSDGIPTYDAKDLALLRIKFSGLNKEKGGFVPELSIFITDNEQVPHFKVVFAAASEIGQENFHGKEYVSKSQHIPHGRMTFKGAKMSSRLGGVPTAEEVLHTIKEVVKEKFTERSAGMDTDAFADMVAIAALKFSILKVAPGKPVNFDPEEALSFEGDSGPYIQYTYVRTRALLEKGDALAIHPELAKQYITTDLERMVYRFEEVALQAAQEYAPHHIAHYLLLLAQTFNSWYAVNKVVDEDNKELSAHRLAVTKAVGTVLKNGLHLLGIQTPERM